MPQDGKTNKKETVKGFAKGWIIFMIIYASSAGLSQAQYLTNTTLGGIMALFMLFCGVMVAGLSLLLKKKAYGLWVLLAGSLLIMALRGSRVGGYTVYASGGLVLTGVTWLVTRKQIRFFGGRNTDTAAHESCEAQMPDTPPYMASPEKAASIPGADSLVKDVPENQMQIGYEKPDGESKTPISAIKPEPVTEPVVQQAHETVLQASSAAPSESERPKTDPSSANKRIGTPVIIGIAAFAVVVAGLLLLTFIRPHTGVPTVAGGSTADIPALLPALTDDSAAFASVIPPSPAGQTQAMTAEQKALLDALSQKLPGVLETAAKQYNSDRAYLAAISRVQLGNCNFSERTLTINILLPSPKSENLETLGIEPYQPHSGAQAYIRENYARLCQLAGDTDTVSYELVLSLVDDLDGGLTLDWSLPQVSIAAFQYSQRFMPYMLDFMQKKGFAAAAFELLLPDLQSWDAHSGADRGQDCAQAYCKALSAALSEEGIQLYGETAFLEEGIQRRLESGFIATFAFDTPALALYNNDPAFTVRMIEPATLFDDARAALRKQYTTGEKPVPASFAELENAYQQEVRRYINGLYADTGIQSEAADVVARKQYLFNWYAVGEKGVAAVPELLRDIQLHLFDYDFNLMFLADSLGVKKH